MMLKHDSERPRIRPATAAEGFMEDMRMESGLIRNQLPQKG